MDNDTRPLDGPETVEVAQTVEAPANDSFYVPVVYTFADVLSKYGVQNSINGVDNDANEMAQDIVQAGGYLTHTDAKYLPAYEGIMYSVTIFAVERVTVEAEPETEPETEPEAETEA